MCNPKHSATYVCRTGTSASSTAHAGTSCETERKRTRDTSSTLLTSFRFPSTTTGKVDPTVTATGRRKGDHEYFIANSLKKKFKKRDFLGIHDRFIRVERFRKNMIELGRSEEIHHITPEEISVYRNNIRSNFVGSDTMPVRHRADFKEALSTLRRLKIQQDQAYHQNWQSSSSSWWNWQDSWWHSSSEYHRDDGPSIDRSGKPDRR